MGKIKSAVFDTGPLIHLNEINNLELLDLFEKILIPNEVLEELGLQIKKHIKLSKNINLKLLNAKNKNISKYILEQYNLDLGESACIALCKQENIKLFFTDDLDAREIAKSMGINVHGTLAIITRCLKEKIINKKETIKIVNELYEKSSLYLTKDLKNWIDNEINKY